MTPSTAVTAPFTELSARRLGPVRRFFVRRPVAMDVVVALWFLVPALAVLTTAADELAARMDVPSGHPTVARVVVVGLVCSLLGTAALMWRRRRPVAVLVAMTGLGASSVGLAGSFGTFDLGVALALYAVAVAHGPRITWIAFGLSAAAVSGAVWMWESTDATVATTAVGETEAGMPTLSSPQLRLLTVLGVVVMLLLAVAIGTSVRNRRLHLAELVERANALARDRDQQARLARAEERSRIAREMHDVVAHSLSVMIALADGASAAMTRAPDRSRAALDELGQTGRSALSDMRRVLGVLDDDAPLEPQPGRLELDDLVEQFRTAGLPVRTTGLCVTLPEDVGLQLALYRIVAEALTNTLRHAPGTARVDLTLTSADGRVDVQVADTGPALPVATSPGAGRGVIGMRERAAVYGGTVDAGPADAGGWRVHAVLPWPGEGEP